MIIRWYINSRTWEPKEREFRFLLGLLPASEQEACIAFKFKADQKRALLSRLLQRAACSKALGIPFEDVIIKRTRGNKPFFAGGGESKPDAPNFNYNVSHEVNSITTHTSKLARILLVPTGQFKNLQRKLSFSKQPGPRVAASQWAWLCGWWGVWRSGFLQGSFVALASEPVCLCGVDVSAPDQLRRPPGTSAMSVLSAFEDQLTAAEVMSHGNLSLSRISFE